MKAKHMCMMMRGVQKQNSELLTSCMLGEFRDSSITRNEFLDLIPRGNKMYLWFKAIHIIALIAWFAGIFYIWRLFVYHTEATSEEVKSTLAVMERKLYFIIMHDRLCMYTVFWIRDALFTMECICFYDWMWLKIFLVILVIGQHHMANFYRKNF